MAKNVRKRNKDEKLKKSVHQLIKKVDYEKMQKRVQMTFPYTVVKIHAYLRNRPYLNLTRNNRLLERVKPRYASQAQNHSNTKAVKAYCVLSEQLLCQIIICQLHREKKKQKIKKQTRPGFVVATTNETTSATLLVFVP